MFYWPSTQREQKGIKHTATQRVRLEWKLNQRGNAVQVDRGGPNKLRWREWFERKSRADGLMWTRCAEKKQHCWSGDWKRRPHPQQKNQRGVKRRFNKQEKTQEVLHENCWVWSFRECHHTGEVSCWSDHMHLTDNNFLFQEIWSWIDQNSSCK